jgi:hypothetical protein
MTGPRLALILAAVLLATPSAQTDTYELVPDWAKLPQGWVFGHPQAFPLPAERDQARATAEKQRAEAIARGETPPPRPRDTLQPGVSGVAVDANDNVYVLHRGKQPILVFDRNGKLLRSGGDGIIGSTPHFIEVDHQGNVWAVDEAAHRVLKFNQALDRVVLQIGVTNQPGHDATHLNLPADIAFTKSGDILIADGYGNNRIAKFSADGTFVKQWGGGPDDRGTRDGQFHLPHAVVVDPNDRIYVVDRRDIRWQVHASRPGVGPCALSRREVRVHHRTRQRTDREVLDRRWPGGGAMGLAGAWAEPVRLGARHRRGFAWRRVRR